MKTSEFISKIQRGLKKPPRVIFKRIGYEISSHSERYLAPMRVRQLTLANLLRKTGHRDLKQIWSFLSSRPYCACTEAIDSSVFETLCPGELETIFVRAKQALEHRVDLLGSGLIALGIIDWHKDYKSEHTWPLIYMRDIDYNNLDRLSDVKFPWELSRLQWLIPAGQAYLLTQNEQYAYAVKEILLNWIKHNPYATGVNWACTMEVALRILTWTWFFHVFKASLAWQDEDFQQRFLTSLYLHADFTERHLEFSDINGNHYTADAAGLVFAGLFFGQGQAPVRWQKRGWQILCQELPKQVFVDGVDFEASIPYHRLVQELFFLPAYYREILKFKTPMPYWERLCRMAAFSAAYTQPDGRVPLWGDADDARALPFGTQAINDHRYLPGIIGHIWKNSALMSYPSGSWGEHLWLLGVKKASLLKQNQKIEQPLSCAFPAGGFYIMRNNLDHVFIDCGPLGLAGRGGHGHNDCLSVEAVLNGTKLISDCGAYVYTASYRERNLFRSTSYHNTPCIDNQEINRFIRWDYLWTMHNDAKPIVKLWQPSSDFDYFRGTHTGYHRFSDPVTPLRTIILHHQEHCLVIQDEILCKDRHDISIPLHLAPNVTASLVDNNKIMINAGQQKFTLYWEGVGEWHIEVVPARVSPSYGVVVVTQKLLWKVTTLGRSTLRICIGPHDIDLQTITRLFSYIQAEY